MGKKERERETHTLSTHCLDSENCHSIDCATINSNWALQFIIHKMQLFIASSSTLSGTTLAPTTKTQMQPFGLLLFVVTLLQLTTAQQAALSSTAPSLVHGGPTTNVPTNCTIVRPLFLALGISSADIPNAANHGKLNSLSFLCVTFHFGRRIRLITFKMRNGNYYNVDCRVTTQQQPASYTMPHKT